MSEDKMKEALEDLFLATFGDSPEHDYQMALWGAQAALAAQPRATVDEVAAIATETWQNYITAKVAVGEEFGIHNGMLHVAQALRNAFPHMFRE